MSIVEKLCPKCFHYVRAIEVYTDEDHVTYKCTDCGEHFDFVNKEPEGNE